VGSRKFFAVPRAELEKPQKEEEPPRAKRKRISNVNDDIGLEDNIQNLVEEVQEIKNEISKFRELAFRHKFSLSFIQAYEEAFSCSICKICPVEPPIIACQACSSIVGCETCTNTWYQNGFDKKCPKCNSVRGLSKTFVLKGFNDLVSQIKVLTRQAEDGQYADTVVIDNDQSDL